MYSLIVFEFTISFIFGNLYCGLSFSSQQLRLEQIAQVFPSLTNTFRNFSSCPLVTSLTVTCIASLQTTSHLLH